MKGKKRKRQRRQRKQKWEIIPTLRMAVVLAIAGALWWLASYFFSSEEAGTVKMEPAKVTDIHGVMELCSVEVMEDFPLKAHIGKKHIFAKMRLNGAILFDADSVDTQLRNDTLFMILPPEKIRVTESDAPGAYKVIDTWNEDFLGSSRFTTAEENRVKKAAVESFLRSLYSRGTVRKARAEASKTIARVAGSVAGVPVVVTDPSPEGYMSANLGNR